MKKYLFLVAAVLGFASCVEKGIDNSSEQNGELVQSYVAITLAADDMTTKAGNDYEAGLSEERVIKSAYVFFFKDGVAFPVSFDGTTSTNEGTLNYLPLNLTGDGQGSASVSDVKDAVLVLQNYKGEYPDKIFVVLNWTPQRKLYNLSELKEEIAGLGNTSTGLVMSNAVYADNAGNTVDAVNLTIDNIAKTAADALANPVIVYVERVAAKVLFSATDEGKFAVEKKIDNKQIYAQIKNFELYNDYENSWLVKRIDPTWASIGHAWNDPEWFRSYWAKSLETDFTDNTFSWSTDNTAIGEYVYCGENTRQWSESNDVRTKVIVKAQLVDEAGNPVEVVSWYGKDYIGEDALKTVVANTIKNTYFSGDGQTFTGITHDDIKCVARDVKADKAYEVYFQLSTTGLTKFWYKYENGNYSKIADHATLNTLLAAVQPALVYTNGMTYYWTDIKHLGNKNTLTEYGVVRNHVYKVNITDITGYGTPIYSDVIDYIKLEKPQDVQSYVAAQVNILSWRIVENDYNLN